MARLRIYTFLCVVFINYIAVSTTSEISARLEQHNGCDRRTEVKRYVVLNDRRSTFLEAWRFCMSIGLRLATVTSAEDTRLLEQAVRGSADFSANFTWWIGGTDLGREGSFVWISTNLPVGYQTGYFNYSPGQPDNYKDNEHCLEIGRFGSTRWNDMPCEAKLRVICENFDENGQ